MLVFDRKYASFRRVTEIFPCFPVKRFIFIVLCAAEFLAGRSASAQSPPAKPGAPRIVNIVNFVRGVEPRAPVDLLEPVAEQIRLAREHGLPSTFLLQYDALIDPRFVDLLKKELRPEDEIGAWLEVVQPQVEAAGLRWRGRFPWDWHTDVGFTVGYSPEDRRKLIDVYMERFRRAFGRLPRSVGCWVIDAPTLDYLADTYGIVAAAICKDQSGTDGYNLWGGYWNQAYYPSRKNAFMPAQTAAEQVRVPVFRLLGSDPVAQYDTGIGHERQGVISLEPVYPDSGGNPAWVRWFFDVNFRAPCLAFAYAQAGQENSFGWPAMERGLRDQFPLLAEWREAGRIRVETMEKTGEWFRRTFPLTPATAVVADSAFRDPARGSIWYESRFYRVNLYGDGRTWFIRDLHLFNENFPERYLEAAVTTPDCTYETLPVMDGYHWSSSEKLAGIRLVSASGEGTAPPLECGRPSVEERVASLVVTVPIKSGGALRLDCRPEGLRATVDGANVPKDWALEMTWDAKIPAELKRITASDLCFERRNFSYSVRCAKGRITGDPGAAAVRILPSEGAIELDLNSLRSGSSGS